MKRHAKKLTLSKTTLRNLSDPNLAAVAGGVVTIGSSCRTLCTVSKIICPSAEVCTDRCP
jgi:hypothetical protein